MKINKTPYYQSTKKHLQIAIKTTFLPNQSGLKALMRAFRDFKNYKFCQVFMLGQSENFRLLRQDCHFFLRNNFLPKLPSKKLKIRAFISGGTSVPHILSALKR